MKYNGWRYAGFLSVVIYVCMVLAGIAVHDLFVLFSAISPERPALQEMIRFAVDHALFLNIAWLAIAAVLLWLVWQDRRQDEVEGGAETRESRS
jgi:hypothetical protein